MSILKSGSNGNVANVGSDKRLDVRAITDETETVFAMESRKYSLSTGLVPVTGNSAIAMLTNDGEDDLVVTSNMVQLVDIVGTATSTGAVVVESNSTVDSGSFTAVDTPLNWNVGSSRVGSFTAVKGEDGATLTGAAQTVRGYFELPLNIILNASKFIIKQGNNLSILIELPAGVTSANIIWSANVYEDNSSRVREL